MLSSSRPSPAAAFTVQQLQQLRAQCAVFLALRNNMGPRQKHLEIALGDQFPAQGTGSSSAGGGGGDGRGADGDDSRREAESSSLPASSSSAVLPPSDLSSLLPSLQLSTSSRGGRRPRRIVVESIKSYLDISSEPATFVQGAIPNLLENTKEEFFNKSSNSQ